MTEQRTFYNKGFQHICQKTADSGIIFYSIQDYLVFYSLLCVKAIKQNIIIIAICLMLNHFHLEGKFKSLYQMERFMQGLLSSFARKYNRQHHLEGQLFKKSYNSSPKYVDEKISNTYIYIQNNPKVKCAVEKSEDYRWNFLKYSVSENPFSEPFRESEASPELLKMMATVLASRSANKALEYSFFGEEFEKLSPKESKQLIDYIIRVYNIIDYNYATDRYGSFENICQVLDVVTGSDYEIKEVERKEDYRHYEKMNEISAQMGINLVKGSFNGLPEHIIKRLAIAFTKQANASSYEIAKYMHIDEDLVLEYLGYPKVNTENS